MASVTTWYQLREDEAELIAYIATLGDLVWVSTSAVGSLAEWQGRSLSEFVSGYAERGILIAQRDEMLRLQPIRVETQDGPRFRLSRAAECISYIHTEQPN